MFIGAAETSTRHAHISVNLKDTFGLPVNIDRIVASRIETGLRVTPDDLRFVGLVERRLAQLAPGKTMRCRVIRGGIRLELCAAIWRDPERRGKCARAAMGLLTVAPYVRGPAFKHVS